MPWQVRVDGTINPPTPPKDEWETPDTRPWIFLEVYHTDRPDQIIKKKQLFLESDYLSYPNVLEYIVKFYADQYIQECKPLEAIVPYLDVVVFTEGDELPPPPEV